MADSRAAIVPMVASEGALAKDVAHALQTLMHGWLLAVLVVAMPQAAAAQAIAPDEARKRLEADRGRLEANKRRCKELQSDLDKIAAERERINARLVETAKLIQQSEGQLSLIESRLGELEAQERHLRGSLEARHGSISALLAAMQRMGRNPPPVMVTRREDALTMVRSAMLLASAFPELRSQAVALSEQLNDLMRVKTSIRTEGEKLRAETSRLNDARVRLAGVQEEKRQSLSERQAELAQVRQAAADISKSVADLGDLISKLDKEVAERTGLGSYEKEIAAAPPASPFATTVEPPAGAKPPAAAPPTKSAAGTGGSPAEERDASIVLAPSGGDRVAMLTPGRIKPPDRVLRGQGHPADAGIGQARPQVRREDPVRQPIQGPRARNPTRRPGGIPVRRLDRVCRRVPQLRPALDH